MASVPAASKTPPLWPRTSGSDRPSPEKLRWCLVPPWELQSSGSGLPPHADACAGEGVCPIPAASGCQGRRFAC